ncbi:MAG: patatin-like phospholipase family protein [Usitatibacter sp.]
MTGALRGAALCLAVAASLACATADARPRVCLVLSGGGARGAAHIGVLKVLEEMRVPVDCIAGTSMGAVVGGAYASGLPMAEMERIVAGIDSKSLFVERPPRDDLAMRRKLDDRGILFGFEVGVRDGDIKLPKGIVSGVQLESVLRSLVRTPGARSFDTLPIPFRAVATDLETGKPVVFADGELAAAMRASMSVPGAIAPAELDGRILVDGGLTDNLPVAVARRMGADVVIAVNLGTPLLRRDRLASALGVTTQMINILTEQNVQASLALLGPGDILIEPELGKFSASDFDNAAKTVPIGEAAARKAAARLAPLALPSAEYALVQAARAAPAPAAQAIDEIRFTQMPRVNPEVARGLMNTKPGEPLEPAVVDRDMRRLFGTGDFERVGYAVVEERDRRVLIVDAVEKSWGPDYLRLGLGLGSDFSGDSFFNAAANYRKTWINPLGAEWRTDLQLGNTNLVRTEFYQPLFVSRALFVAPRLEAQRRRQDVFQGDARIARFNVRSRLAGFDVGSELWRLAELRVGAVAGSLAASEETGPPELAPPAGRIGQGALTARLLYDQLDSVNFPRSGATGQVSVFASTPGLGAELRYTRWDADLLTAFSIGRHTLQLMAKGGAPEGSTPLPAYDQFVWGGFLQQSGYAHGALTGQRLAFGRAVYYYKLSNQTIFEGAYAGMSLEAGRLGGPLVAGGVSGVLKSAAMFVAVDTPVGPIYLGYGKAAGGSSAVYLYLGRP